MKKKVILTLILTLAFCLALSLAISAATYYIDYDGNVVDSTSENIAYEFDVGGDRTTDGNKCFRIPKIYLHDTTVTKIVFPVASQIKSGYTGIAPQGGWNSALKVFAVNAEGSRIEDASYATQIETIEFLSGVDFDGAYSSGAFSGFSGLKRLIFNGNVSSGHDASNKGGFFSGTQITTIDIHGSGEVNLAILRHISANNNLTVTLHKDCTSTVYLRRGSYYCLPSATVSNWTFVINPNVSFANLSTTEERLALCGSGTPTLNVVMAVDSKSLAPSNITTSHGIVYSNANTEVVTATLKSWCELGYDEHNSSVTLTFGEKGFLGEMTVVDGCDKCLAGATEQLPAIFTTLGYSAPENGKGGIVLGFVVNSTSMERYTAISEKTIKYGIFAVSQDKLGSNDILNTDGSAAVGVIKSDMTYHNNAAFELKLTGFDSDERKAAKIALGAYVIASNTDGNEISYLQVGAPSDGEKYNFVSFNDVVSSLSAAE